MKRMKRVLVILLVLVLLGGAGAGALTYMKKANQKEVMVVNVSSVTGTYYSDETMLDGNISTSVSQNVTVDSDMIIQDIFVQEGSEVVVGDQLISFDTTLVEMELNIARLKKQQQQQELAKAKKRLNSLKNGGPIDESSSTGGGLDTDSLQRDDSMTTEGGEELSPVASAGESTGNFLAAIRTPLLLAGLYQEELFGDGNDFSDGNSGDDVFTSGEQPSPTPSPTPIPTPTPVLDADTDYFDPYNTNGPDDFNDGEAEFYSVLDETSIPYTGSGTEEDPFVFFCGSAKGYVTAKGSFLNRMAGYNGDGSKIEKEGGYWYQLEFHESDTVVDFSNRRLSCTGYYLIDGSMLEKPVDMGVETEFTIDGAMQYEENMIPDDMYPDDNWGGGSTAPSMTRAEAVKVQQNKIAGLELDIQESDIEISKLEQKVKKKIMYSKLDGTVSHVGDPLTDTDSGKSFITVQSKDGYYVKGTVSELMRDRMKEGTILNCMSYSEGGMGGFEAEVIDLSDYPVESGSYYGMGNPNVSYYSFSAVVTDKSLTFPLYDYVNITLPSEEVLDGAIILQREFVRSENGINYAYKDDNGVLKKQVLSVGGSVNSGYYMIVNGGLTLEDKVAFAYGKDVKEGAKTREATIDQLYGY